MRFYFPQLDGLRAIAMLLVVIHHLPSISSYFEPSIIVKIVQRAQSFGWIGVDLFLCLSAYLITKLLVIEQDRTGTISIKNFLIRRSLRIWPLYFLAITLGFALLPLLGIFAPNIVSAEYSDLVNKHLIPYLLFGGNWSTGYYGYASGDMLGHLWTISLEEQFYLIWPFFLKVCLDKGGIKFVGQAVAFLFLFIVVMRYFIYLQEIPHPFIWTSTITRLDPMLIGTLVAIMPKENFERAFGKHPELVCFFISIGMFSLLTFTPNIDNVSALIHFQYPITALASGALLLAVLNPGLPSQLTSFKLLTYIGRISYGCYVYHVISIGIGGIIVEYFISLGLLNSEGSLEWFVQSLLSVILTIAISAVSYRFFEVKFLLHKKRFTSVESRPL